MKFYFYPVCVSHWAYGDRVLTGVWRVTYLVLVAWKREGEIVGGDNWENYQTNCVRGYKPDDTITSLVERGREGEVMSNKLTPRLHYCVSLQLWARPMKIQHFYVNPAIWLSGTTPSIISNTETRSGEITRQDASLTVWLSQARSDWGEKLVMALSISAVIWSVSLGSVSTVEQTQGSRSHTGTHTICSMNTMLDTTCITPHTSSPDVSLTQPGRPPKSSLEHHPWIQWTDNPQNSSL